MLCKPLAGNPQRWCVCRRRETADGEADGGDGAGEAREKKKLRKKKEELEM